MGRRGLVAVVGCALLLGVLARGPARRRGPHVDRDRRLRRRLPGVRRWRGRDVLGQRPPTTAETTSASVDNLFLVADGDSEVAFSLADTAIDAVEGRDSFDGERLPLRALGTLYSNFTHVVALKSGGITKIEDLKGKTVSIGAPNSGTEVIGLRLLEVAGLDPDTDVTRRAGRGGVGGGAAGGLDRRVRVVGRPADRRDHRPRDHGRDRAPAARRLPAEAQRALRRGLRRGRGGGGRVPGASRRSRRSASRTC